MSQIRTEIVHPVNQDTSALKVIHYWADGRRFYAKSIEWEEFKPYNELDLSGVTFPGRVDLV